MSPICHYKAFFRQKDDGIERFGLKARNVLSADFAQVQSGNYPNVDDRAHPLT
jgi:hypothetical protein